MNDALFGIPNMDIYLVFGILVIFILLEGMAGYWATKRTFNDWMQEAGALVVLSFIITPIMAKAKETALVNLMETLVTCSQSGINSLVPLIFRISFLWLMVYLMTLKNLGRRPIYTL